MTIHSFRFHSAKGASDQLLAEGSALQQQLFFDDEELDVELLWVTMDTFRAAATVLLTNLLHQCVADVSIVFGRLHVIKRVDVLWI